MPYEMMSDDRWDGALLTNPGVLTLNKTLPASDVTSADLAPVKPYWLPKIATRLSDLARLGDGWDGYGAAAIRRDTVYFVAASIGELCLPFMKEPQIVPVPNGGLQLEWHDNGVDIELEITEPYAMQLYVEYLDSGNEIEREISSLRDPDLVEALRIVTA